MITGKNHGKKGICVKRFVLFLLVLMLLCGASSADESKLDAENNSRVFYEIFVGSFSDSDGDGTGDLRGIINRMDYLNDGNPESMNSLGIEGIWLTPVFLSPSYHKYDVTDYYRIDPQFGTLDDLTELIRICHERDVKLILDLPLNHTGRDCAWFDSFRKAHEYGDASDPYYDFYVWIGGDEAAPAGRRFEKLYGTDIRYECNFSGDMPELNFDSEEVRSAVLDVAAYWMDYGVDGFRFDAAKYPYYGEHEKNAEFWCWYMDELKKINPHIYTVAEVWDGDGIIDRYLPAFSCFRFSTAMAEGLIAETARGGNVDRLVLNTANYLDHIRSINPDAVNVPFIANHDTDRAAGYLTVASGAAQMAANLYLLSPGSPFIYYGEEIGLRGSRGGENTDANRRLAMRWGDGDTVADPVGSTYDTSGFSTVADREKSKSSILWHYRKVIALRKANPEIARGTYTALSFPDSNAGGFLCEWNGSVVGVFHNPTGKARTLDLSQVTDIQFSEITFLAPIEEEATLEGNILTLGAQTSAILR